MLLEVSGLHVSYGHIEVIKGISFSVAPGEIVAIIGANGAGKTTTLCTVSGLLRPRSGRISFEDRDVSGSAVEDIVTRGLAHCPEGRRIFPGLTVKENLLSGAAARRYVKAAPRRRFRLQGARR